MFRALDTQYHYLHLPSHNIATKTFGPYIVPSYITSLAPQSPHTRRLLYLALRLKILKDLLESVTILD